MSEETDETFGPMPPWSAEYSAEIERLEHLETKRNIFQENHLPSFTGGGRKIELSPRQHTAVNLLVMGKPLSAVAAALQIGRTTLFRWRRQNPLFVAELNRRRSEVYEAAENRLRCLMLQALRVIDEDLHNDYENTRVAFKLLPHMSPRRIPPPQGPMTVDEAVDAIARARRSASDRDIKNPVSDDERAAVWRETEDDTSV